MANSIHLRKMSRDEYAAYLKYAIKDYAAEKMKAEGLNEAEAMKVAQHSFDTLLPEGLSSDGQYLFSMVEDASEKVVGTIWFGEKKVGNRNEAFIYDILLAPEYRGKGWGKQAMALLEGEVKKRGLSAIGLHVFGHNEVAYSLYKKMGFKTTNRIMKKDV